LFVCFPLFGVKIFGQLTVLMKGQHPHPVMPPLELAKVTVTQDSKPWTESKVERTF
jgi:hypothetical protein